MAIVRGGAREAGRLPSAAMANDRQFKLQTKFVATRGVEEYRASVATWVQPSDSVLEIGCEWGATSVVIAERAPKLLATDISSKVIERARETHPTIEFAVLDAFDVRAALEFGRSFDKIYVDMSGLSGYRSLLDAISLLTMYATVFRPAAIVIKSGALKQFARNCVAWSGPAES